MPPNILIVMTDHQRADTVLPGHPALTPNLDGFARDGLSFSQTYCPAPHCCPSRATFFTGLYPTGHGVWNNIGNGQALSRGVRPGVRMWSEDLRGAGYELHFVGKWHVSMDETPKDRGWIEHFVSATRADQVGMPWSYYQNLPPDPSERQPGQILRPGYGAYQMYGQRPEVDDHHDQRVLTDTLAALAGLKDSEQPWCLYAGLIGPHDPYLAPERFLDLYPPESVRLPESYADKLEDKPRVYKRMREQLFDQISPDEAREGIRHYWAYCSYLDDIFGQILAGLEATGQADNTLVVYCSDHGDYCGDHGLFAKGIPCFQGAYHVPLVARWPAGIRHPGRRVDAFASPADLSATFLEAAGIPGYKTSGQSLVPFFRDQQPETWRDAVFTQCNGIELYYTQRSVMTREYKYVYNGFDDDELYDLGRDPHEMVNQAGNPAYNQVKRELVKRLWQFARSENDAAIDGYITVGLAPWGPGIAFE